jgi:predicted signal transduction protein with EAL and GGDEF domain
LVDILGRPYLVQGKAANVGASIGIAVAEGGLDADELIRHADLALHHAKGDGGRTFRTFNPKMDERARLLQVLESDLRKALPMRQFELHYQPQVNLRTQLLVGFEALLRWNHPERGLVSPVQFIPIAEEIGLIVPIGEWALRTACKQAAQWSGELTVAVNVSAVQLEDGARLIRAVRGALETASLPGHRLEVEITESALVRRANETLAVLHELRGMGVKVSMDDFGTGYSSLSQLRSFPFTKIKIDRSFVQDLENNPEGMAVVRAIVALGAALGMSTTAEGVETASQASVIQAEGCTDMQGYLVSPPLPSATADQFVNTYDPSQDGPFRTTP